MAQQSYVVYHLFIMIYLVSISRSTSLPDESSLLPQDYIEEVAGYNSEAYPSYFSAIDDGSSDSVMLETRAPSSAKTVNVDEFGAKGDGKSDDTQAFKKAWSEACSSSTSALFVVSKNKNYLVKQITFQGPCKAPLTMKIYGTIEASADRSDYEEDEIHWLLFENVNNLVIDGGGTFNGNGKIWWQNSCKIDKSRPCTNAPTALTFYKGQNLTVSNLKIENAQQIQVSFERCVNVEASNLQVTAPGSSPNTDGIHITGTTNMQLSSSSISTGDDCVSIETGTQNLQITDLTCGPGHGISIGSLGDGHSEAYVSDVTVNRAKLSGTTNGVRIKTYQGGSGSATNIKFQNINMQNVENPIIIDQYYCDKATPCKQQTSAVQVKNVVYQNIKGTSGSSLAINFNCSKSYPCQGIILQDISLTTDDGKAAKANCNHVNLKEAGKVSPQCP